MSPVRARRLLALLIAAAVPALAAGGAFSGADRSLAIYPHQSLPLRFDHAQHLALDMKCISCHDVDTSSAAADRNVPPQATCETCHEIEAAAAGEETDPPSACSVCHPGFDPTVRRTPAEVVIPAPNLKFDHRVHLQKEIPCSRCHGDMTRVQLATRAQLPKMETCLECHAAGKTASGACSTCHITRAGGLLAQVLPGGARLVPEIGNPFGVGHGPGYERQHELDAVNKRAVCAECHAESDCLVCHAGTMKVLSIHPNDWITLHPVPAKLESLRCVSCHHEQSFCVDCHQRAGLSLGGPSALQPTSRVQFHPEGWADTLPGPNHHGYWASRNIETCVSCHREEDCIGCHATTGRAGFGFDPHPPGFRSQASAVCSKNPRVCLKCHERTDAALAGCL